MPNTPSRCLIKRDFRSLFTGTNTPQLLYITHIQPSDQAHPRILHAHENLVEVLLICAGSAKFRISETTHEVRAGDLLVYNSGVVHDEISDQENAVESYCVGIGGLQMPGLRENALLPDDAPPVCPMGDEAEDLRQIYDMMYRYIAADRPGCEALCISAPITCPTSSRRPAVTLPCSICFAAESARPKTCCSQPACPWPRLRNRWGLRRRIFLTRSFPKS